MIGGKQTMKCSVFKKDIDEFKSHPILYNKLIEMHKRDSDNCNCKLRRIEFD